MRQYWVTIAMAAVLAGLGAYVYFADLPAERAQSAKEAAEKKLLPFTDRDVTGLTIRTSGSEIVLASDPKRTWRITAPLATEAESREVDTLLRSLELGKVTRVVEEKATDLAPFGLEHPAVVLALKAGNKAETLSLGDAGPISSTLYAMRASDRKVLLTDLTSRDFYNKTLLTLRKKTVVTIDQTKVDRLRLTYPTAEFVLHRVENHNNKKWMVRSPIETQADQSQVRKLLLKLEDLRAVGFIDPGPEHRTLMAKLARVKAPQARVVVHENGQNGKEQAVAFYQLDPKSGEAYAVITKEDPIFRIPPVAIKAFIKGLFILRDKRLLGVSSDDIARLTVKTREESYALIRKNGAWVLESKPDQPLRQETPVLLVSRVAELQAERQVVTEVGPLKPYGLTAPTAEFTATTKDGKQAGRLLLGKKTGGLVYAMGQGLPGIYRALAFILDQIPTQNELLTAKPHNQPASSS